MTAARNAGSRGGPSASPSTSIPPSTSHGQQQLTFFNGHCDTACYLPLVATLTFNDEPTQYLVGIVLRPSNSTATHGTIGRLRALFAQVLAPTLLDISALDFCAVG